jgi:hypothetical protein
LQRSSTLPIAVKVRGSTPGAEHCEYHHDLAETVPGPSTERIAELARKLEL